MTDTTDLIERLRARDRQWQKSCDQWVKQLADAGQPCSAETEAGMRAGTYGEAADAIERLRSIALSLYFKLATDELGIVNGSKLYDTGEYPEGTPDTVHCLLEQARAALAQGKPNA